MAVGLAGATILAVPVSIYYLNTYPAMPTREVLRSVSMFAGYSIPKTLIGKTYRQIDLLLLGFLSTSAVAGYYGVAFKITIPVLMVSGVLSSGLMARVSNLHSKNRDVTDDVTNALSFASVLSVPIFIGSLVLASEVVVTAYGAEYADAAVFLIGIAFYRVFQTQSSQLDSSLNGLDRPDLSFRASGVGLGVNVLLGVGLTVWYGPIGIVVATIVAEAIQYVLLRRMVRNLLPDVDFFPDGLKQQVVGGVVMGIIVLIADFLVPPIPITGLRVLCLLAIGVLSYVAWLQRHGTPVSSLFRTLSNPA
jgi:O-antigen/teichoic acid export membrane protein